MYLVGRYGVCHRTAVVASVMFPWAQSAELVQYTHKSLPGTAVSCYRDCHGGRTRLGRKGLVVDSRYLPF